MRKVTVKSLHKKCSALWKEICFKRDGIGCQVQHQFPYIEIYHSEPYQVDHCFSRSNKILFYEVDNGTVVCASCNMAKGFKNKSVDRAIDEIVKKRIGKEKFDAMLKIDMSKSANINFNKKWWLEEKIIELQDILLKTKEIKLDDKYIVESI